MRDYLKKARLAQGKTLLEIANQLCISESYYFLIENGERQKKLSLDLASKISEILSIPIAEILEHEKAIKE